MFQQLWQLGTLENHANSHSVELFICEWSSGTAVVEVMDAVCYTQKHLSFSKCTFMSKILFVPDVDFSFICLSLIHSKYKNSVGG